MRHQSLDITEREALLQLSGEWQAGPGLPEVVIRALPGLRDAGLVERLFLDNGAPGFSSVDGSLTVRLSACWHFRLTSDGLAARAALAEQVEA